MLTTDDVLQTAAVGSDQPGEQPYCVTVQHLTASSCTPHCCLGMAMSMLCSNAFCVTSCGCGLIACVQVIGNVSLGQRVSIWYGAILRGACMRGCE
jgi:hypothetical protein